MGRTPAKLSQAEVEIVRLLIAGKTRREIAIIYRIGLRAIDKRIERITQKLDVPSQLLIITAAIVNEIMTLDEVKCLLAKRPPEPDPY